MFFRACIVIAVCCWYVCVRNMAYYFLRKDSEYFGSRTDFSDQVFAWGIAIPLTAMSILIPTAMMVFIIHG